MQSLAPAVLAHTARGLTGGQQWAGSAMRAIHPPPPPALPGVQHEFFIPGGVMGAARRMCAHLPPNALVRSFGTASLAPPCDSFVGDHLFSCAFSSTCLRVPVCLVNHRRPPGDRGAGHAPLSLHSTGSVRQTGGEGEAAG